MQESHLVDTTVPTSRALIDMQIHMAQAQVDVLRRTFAKEPPVLSTEEASPTI